MSMAGQNLGNWVVIVLDFAGSEETRSDTIGIRFETVTSAGTLAVYSVECVYSGVPIIVAVDPIGPLRWAAHR